MAYDAPVDDILSALKTAADWPRLMANGAVGDLDLDTVGAIVGEAGTFATEVLAPLNWSGDRAGAKLSNGKVTTAPGFKDAYNAFSKAGWTALPCPEQFGGQDLPCTVAMAVCEVWNAANLAFGICPLLTNGAIDSLHIGGSSELKSKYLPNLVSGKWTGTMNLTEPQAGSDLSAVTTKAVKHADGSYRLTGTKIYISYGEHDLTENIIHLVLARIPGAPAGTKGISLFVVPKMLVNDDGTLGARNDVVCAGIEHKLGIIASPTCVMKYGENGGAIAYLVGEENTGLATMFIMMNAARLAVGIQGVAIADRATQRAIAFANERKQGRGLASKPGTLDPIAVHPDVQRMLISMQATTSAARGICLATAAATDEMNRANDANVRAAAADRVALLTPIAKAYATDSAVEVASLGIQVHGGMGFVEETGAAQHLRDARILPIYEGTNGIQAIDLVTRKLPLAGGAAVKAYLAELDATIAAVEANNDPTFGQMGARMRSTLSALIQASSWMANALAHDMASALAGATPYLRLFSLASGGHYLAKAALLNDKSGNRQHRIQLARFYAEQISVSGPSLALAIKDSGEAQMQKSSGSNV
jgi:acyl-CoA dehydrogenase